MRAWISAAIAVLVCVALLPGALALFLVVGVTGPAAKAANPCVNPFNASVVASADGLRLPLVGTYRISSSFGNRLHPVTGEIRGHNGVDLSMSPHGGKVLSMAAGVVSSIGSGGAGGNIVTVDHGDGLVSKYMHLASVMATKGDKVLAGQQVGVEGATGRVTGPHLHWEVWENGAPVDPVPWAAERGMPLTGQAPPLASPADAVAATPSGVATTTVGEPAAAHIVSRMPSEVAGFTGEQLVNAGHIITTGQAMKLDSWTITVAVMTAMGESSLVNLNSGDAAGPDSRGLFQQRANGAWGSQQDRMNPRIAATNFYRALQAVPGYRDLPPTMAAHRTQRNADADHYTKFWDAATKMVAALTGDPAVLAALPASAGTATCTAEAVAGAVEAVPPGPGGECPVTTSPGERGLKPVPLRGLRCTKQAFALIHTIYGVGSRGGPSDHPSGMAVDFMIDDYRSPAGRAYGWQVAEWTKANADALGVKYIIFDMKVWRSTSPDRGWTPYTRYGPSPNDTLGHRDHVHVSYR